MKMFKLLKMAFNYSRHVDLYCSDKRENIILHDQRGKFSKLFADSSQMMLKLDRNIRWVEILSYLKQN